MHQTESIGYATGAGWQTVELPYAGGKLALDVIVPDAGKFAAVAQTLDNGTAAFLGHIDRRAVHLSLPKFKFRTQAELVDTFRALGLTDLFDPGRADLSAMTTADKLSVSHVLHEAFIDVNEKGTEAAAATAVVARATAAPSQPVVLSVDRPFIIALRDLETNTLLFLGRVLDPTT